MTDQTLRLGRLERASPLLGVRMIDEEERTIELAFSSEAPVRQFFGTEILGHAAGEVDLSRVESGVCPLLVNHDWERQIGRVISARIDADRIGRAVVRLSRSAAAEEIFQDVIDGIRSGVSVGYQIRRLRLEEEGEDGEATYRAVDWAVFEISLVSVPADPSVGVGRAAGGEECEVPIEGIAAARSESEGEAAAVEAGAESLEIDADPAAEAGEAGDEQPAGDRSGGDPDSLLSRGEDMPEGNNAAAPAENSVNMEQVRAEQRREVSEILRLGAMHNQRAFAEEMIAEGVDLPAFRGRLLERLGTDSPLEAPASEIGMSRADVQRFSLLRAIDAQVRNDWSRAGFEREVVQAVAERVMRSGGSAPRGFLVPYDWMASRDLTAAGSGTGAELVGTDHLAGSFIELLRTRAMVMQLGARTLSGLVGDVSIPKQISGATAYWLASETATTTESTPGTGAVTLTPKTVSGRVDISRQMRLQSDPSVDGLVREDLISVLARAIDLAAINGSGASGQPEGILQMSGIGDVAGGTNGLAPTWAHMVELETDVAVANADMGSLAYLTSAKVRGKLKTTEKASSTAQFVWENGAGAGEGSVNGYRAAVSNQVPDTLTKGTSSGVCSAIIFGNFADLLVGEWGVLDITADPYTSGDSGAVIMRAFQSVDIKARHEESFSAMQDALTA